MKQSDTVKKLAMAGVLTAVAVVGSLLSFPIFGSNGAPVQHLVNILAAVVLGPGWGVGSMLRTKINVNLGVSRDCKDYDIEMQKVMSAVNL